MSTYAYIRVSTEVQCFSSQKHEIKSYCQRHGIVVDKWVSESVSGTIAVEKRILGRTIRKMKTGDLLICTELSRLGRNMLMIMDILNRCSTKGISLLTIKDNFTLSDNINSKIVAFAFALAARASFVRCDIRFRSISAAKAKANATKEALAVKRMEGVRLGRPPGSSKKKLLFIKDYMLIRDLLKTGENMSEIAKRYGIHRNTVRKYLMEIEKSNKS